MNATGATSVEPVTAVPLVTPARLPPAARAGYERMAAEVLDTSRYRSPAGWCAQVGGLVADLLGVVGDDAWAVAPLRSGTDALVRALVACGVGPGARVAVPDLAFHVTAASVLLLGAEPVMVDVSPDDWNLDPDAVEAAAPAGLAAILAVDNYGTPADWAALRRVADRAGARLIVDACESLGARRDGASPARFADAVVFSFSFTKPVHAAGMGGALVARTSLLRGYDPVRMTDSQCALPELNAAYLVAAWPSLGENIQRLRATYREYEHLAGRLGWSVQCEHGTSTRLHAPLLVPEEGASRRDELIDALGRAGVASRAQFPSQSALLGLGAAPPVSNDVAGRVVSLPTGAGLAADAVGRVVEVVEREARRLHLLGR